MTLAACVAMASAGGMLVAGAKPPNPRAMAGEVSTCTQAGVPGRILFGSAGFPAADPAAGHATISADGRSVAVVVQPGLTATAIVVRVGHYSYVYKHPLAAEQRMKGRITRWFVCVTSGSIRSEAGEPRREP